MRKPPTVARDGLGGHRVCRARVSRLTARIPPVVYTRPMRIRLAAATIAAIIALPAAAAAETRYASPTGTGTACTRAVPCDIKVALTDDRPGDAGIDANDLVELAAGSYGGRRDADASTYSPGDELRISKGGVQVYGATTGVSLSKGARIFVSSPLGLVLGASGVQLRDVLVWGTGGNSTSAVAVLGAGARIQRVYASSPGAYGCAVSGNSAIVTYAVCRGQGGIRVGFPISGTGTQRLQNITAIATGQDGNGIVATASGTANARLDLLNAIVRGADMAADVSAAVGDAARLQVVAVTSNYRTQSTFGGRNATITEPGSGLNTTIDPGFGFYSQLADQYYRLGPESPLIDRGSTLQVGATGHDVFGILATNGQRSVGAYDYDPGLSPLPAPAPPPEVLEQIGGAGGAAVTPPADPGQQAGGGPEVAPSVAPSVDLARPRAVVRRNGVTVRSRVTVPGAGTLTQRVAVRRGKRLVIVCTATIDVLQSGRVRVACPLRRQVRSALRTQRQRLVVTTTFASGGASAQRVHRLVLKRAR